MARKPQRPSLASVARRAGVSQASASLILNGRGGDYRLSDTTSAKVMAAATQLGYARPQRRKGPQRIHVVHFADILRMDERGLGSAVLYPLLDALTAQGWLASVDPRLPADAKAAGPILFTAAAAVIPVNLGQDATVRALAAAAAAGGTQPVILGRHAADFPGLQVDGDQAGGAGAAAEHLLALGHRRIALVAGVTGDPHSDARIAGFTATCTAQRCELTPGDTWGEGGYEAADAHRLVASRLAGGARPTAIFCCNDRMALGALLALRESGLRVPEDVSLVGFDDQTTFCAVAPGITTVRIDAGGIGPRLAARMAAGGAVQTERITIPARLVVRGSTAQVRRKP